MFSAPTVGRTPRRKHGAYAGAQLVRVERLDEVVVGAELEAADLVFVVVLGGEQDHRDAGALAQAAHDFEPGHVGHDDVEDDDVGALLLGDAQRFFAVVGDDDAKSLARKLELDQAQDAGFVVDGQNKRFDGHTVFFLFLAGYMGWCHIHRAASSGFRSPSAGKTGPLPPTIIRGCDLLTSVGR